MNIRLKMAILTTGRTQRQFAGALGMGEVRLSEIIRCAKMPSADEMNAIAVELDMSMEHLFFDSKME